MSGGKSPSRSHPILGAPQERLRLDLELADPAADEPFLPLDEAGLLARVLLARVGTPDAGGWPVALKLQRDLPPSASPGRPPLANPQIDDYWSREQSAHRAMAGAGAFPLIPLGTDADRSRPLLYCRAHRVVFHPPCPACGAELEDCRDDALLREVDLPEYAGSNLRYLYCRACSTSARRVFYSASSAGDEHPRGALVRRRDDLVRDLAQAGPEAKAAVPCAACGDRLAPLTFLETRLTASEPWDLSFDEACALAGGASWSELRDRVRSAAPGRGRLLDRLDARLGADPVWLLGADAGGRQALEALWLKLGLFAQACRAVRDFHAHAGTPHLGLGPSAFGARLSPAGDGVPARWAVDLRLTALAGPVRLFSPAHPAPEARELWAPPPDADPLFVSPQVLATPPGREEPLRVTVRGVGEAEARPRLDGVLVSDRARLDEYRAGDVVRLLPSSGPLQGRALWATLGAREDRGFAFAASPEDGQALRKPADFTARGAFFRRPAPAADHHALGLLLFRALLANDERDALAVDDAVRRVLRKLLMACDGQSSWTPRRVATELALLVDAERPVFDPASVLRRKEDRPARASAVPSRLWGDVLELGFRLVTSIPGFSFDGGAAALAEEAEQLRRRTAIELFSRADRDRELNQACEDVLGELAGSAEGASRP